MIGSPPTLTPISATIAVADTGAVTDGAPTDSTVEESSPRPVVMGDAFDRSASGEEVSVVVAIGVLDAVRPVDVVVERLATDSVRPVDDWANGPLLAASAPKIAPPILTAIRVTTPTADFAASDRFDETCALV